MSLDHPFFAHGYYQAGDIVYFQPHDYISPFHPLCYKVIKTYSLELL